MKSDVHPVSLSLGILYVIFGAGFLLEALDAVDLRWDLVWPIALIVAGVVVLFGSVKRGES
jgi:hypothetical protein